MMEKIKDYLYDISDILVSLVLIAVIAVSITYKITDAFTIKIFNPIDDSVITVQEQIKIPEEDQPAETEEIEITEIPDTTVTPIEVKPSTKVAFEINSGLTGYNIANLLLEKGLISNVNSFIERVEALGLGSKLRSGTFSVPSDIPLDELIFIITGKK
ncbi:MAG: hypothetical protein JW702_11885 [Clostridiales bacterium]|nr:hypothetical protein [Clostridiales bacterium]